MEIVYVLIKAIHGKLKLVSSKLGTYEEVEEVNEVFGSYDIIAKVVAEDKDALRQFMQNKFLITEGISDSETLLVF